MSSLDVVLGVSGRIAGCCPPSPRRPPAGPAPRSPGRPDVATGIVRYWAAAKAAAGREAEPYDAATLQEALDAACAAHPDLARVLPRCSFLIDGVRAQPVTPLPDGAVIEVLPPFAGG